MRTISAYEKGGTQKQLRDMIDRTWEKMYGGGAGEARQAGSSKLALMFLTRGDVNLPQVWRDFVAAVPERVRIYSHPKDPAAVEGGFLEDSVIREHFETEWGSISLLRATLAMLREALEDESLTHFVLLSESCVPVRPLPEILRELDWNPKPRFKSRTLSEASQLQKSRAAPVPEVPDDCWRFQSQWWLLDRIAANWVARADYTDVFEKMGIPDEAYFSTVLCLLGYPVDDRCSGKPVTWVHWEKDVGRPTEHDKISMEILEVMLESGACGLPGSSRLGRTSGILGSIYLRLSVAGVRRDEGILSCLDRCRVRLGSNTCRRRVSCSAPVGTR